MTKTTQVAEDRAYDDTKTVIPAEVAQGAYIENAPSLQALKLMHLMIGRAGGRMAEDVTHQMRLSDIKKIDGLQNHSRQTIVPLFAELRAATIIHDDAKKKRTTIGGLLDETTVDYRDEESGDILISWGFGRTFRRMAEHSNHWAILDRQAVFSLGSKYSVLLFQHISSLKNMQFKKEKTFSVPELRAVLGISDGKIKRFADLKKDVLLPAIKEINSDLTRLTLSASYHKTGRTITGITIAWDEKPDLTKVKKEQDRSKVGRKARQAGTADTLALSFPSTGSVKYTTPWEQIARGNCNWDHGKIADAFRSFCAGKNIRLDAKNIETVFTNFCKKQPKL